MQSDHSHFDTVMRRQQREEQAQHTGQREAHFSMFIHPHLQPRLHTPTPIQHDYFSSHTHHPSVGLESASHTPNPAHTAGALMTPLHRHQGNEQQHEHQEGERHEHQHAQHAHADLFEEDAPSSSHPPRQMREDQAMHAAPTRRLGSSSPDPQQRQQQQLLQQAMRHRQPHREPPSLGLTQLVVHFNEVDVGSDAVDSEQMDHALLPASTQPLQQHFRLAGAAAADVAVGGRKRKHDDGSAAAGDAELSHDREHQAKLPRTWLSQDQGLGAGGVGATASAVASSSSSAALLSYPPYTSSLQPPPRYYLPPPAPTVHSVGLPSLSALMAPSESRMMQSPLVQQQMRQPRTLLPTSASSHSVQSAHAPMGAPLLPPPALQSVLPRWRVGSEVAASAMADRHAPAVHSSTELLHEAVERLQAQNATLRSEVQAVAWHMQEKQQRHFIQQQQERFLSHDTGASALHFPGASSVGLAPWPSHMSLSTVPLRMLSEFETKLTTQLAGVRAEQARRNGCIGVPCHQRRGLLVPNERNTVCLPCGHRVLCESCMADSSSCPSCRVVIERFIIIESDLSTAPTLGASAATASAPTQRHRIISKPKPNGVHVVSDDESEQAAAPHRTSARGVGSSAAAAASRRGSSQGSKEAATSSASRGHASGSPATASSEYDSRPMRATTQLVSKASSGGASASSSSTLPPRRRTRPKLSDSEDYEPPSTRRSKSRRGNVAPSRPKPKTPSFLSADLFLSAAAPSGVSIPAASSAAAAAADASSSPAQAASPATEPTAAAASSSSADSQVTPTSVVQPTAMTRKLAMLKPRDLSLQFNSMASAAAAAVTTATGRAHNPVAESAASATNASVAEASCDAPPSSASAPPAASSELIPPLEQCSPAPSMGVQPPVRCSSADVTATAAVAVAPLQIVVTPASPVATTNLPAENSAMTPDSTPKLTHQPLSLAAVLIAAQRAADAAHEAAPFDAVAHEQAWP